MKLKNNWALCFFILLSVQVKSQSLEGAVKDSAGTYLEGTTVSLLHLPDSSAAGFTLTNATGKYIFQKISKGTYVLKVTMSGRQVYYSPAVNYESGIKVVPDIILHTELKQLQVVEVKNIKKIVDIQAGKIIYNVENSIVSSGSSAYDILRQTPTISIGQEDNLLIKGNSNINVMIDGKMTYLTNDQLTTMLRGMPSETIKSIEVISIPSSQYDAAGTAGMINIVTKRIRKKGYALNLTSGFTGGTYGSTVQSILGNIANTHFNIYGGYTYNYQSSYRISTSHRVVDSTVYSRQSFDPSYANNNSYKLGVDFYINRKQEIGILYNGYSNTRMMNSVGPTQLSGWDEIPDSIVRNHNVSYSPSVNNSFNINYIFRIDSNGRDLSAEVDYIHYNNNYYGTQGNQFFSPKGDSLQPFQQLRFQQPSIVTIKTGKIDANIPWHDIKFTAGAKYSSVKTDNNFSYDSLINGDFVHSNTLSNYFIYTETVGALYITAAKEWKNISVNAGLRGELTHSTGDLVSGNIKNENNYFDLFPYLAISRTISPDFKADLAFDRRINRPVYADLNPTKFYRDKYVYIQGNPFLNPEIGWNTSVSFTGFDRYVMSISYNITTDPMLTYAYQDSATGQLRITTLNFSSKHQMDMLLSVPVKIGHFWEMQNAVDLSYQTFDLQQAQQSTFTVKMWSIDISSTNSFLLPEGIKGELTIHYTSPSVDGIYVSRYFFDIQAGLKKSFFHKKLDAILSVSDLLRTNRSWGYSILPNVNTTFNHHFDSRLLTVNLTYHLGGSLKQAKKINVDEQKRI